VSRGRARWAAVLLLGTVLGGWPAGGSAGQAAAPRPAPRVGDAAPSAPLTSLDGDAVDLRRFHGRVVVLDFWATWCGPCVAALPSLKGLAAAYGDRVAVVSISGDTDGGRLREFVNHHAMTWTQCWDGNGDAQRRFRVHGLPTYFVLDGAGRIAYTQIGWDSRGERALRRGIDKALATPGGGGGGGGQGTTTAAAGAVSATRR
jgi:thiol-disulfide isomerase/thioredoxin